MPTFGTPDKLKDSATYKATLKTAIGTLNAGSAKKFAYYKAVDFGAQKHSALLVDFDLSCTSALAKRGAPAPVLGFVSVTDDNKLKFVSNAGKVIGGPMQRALTLAGVSRVVFIPAGEENDYGTDPQTAVAPQPGPARPATPPPIPARAGRPDLGGPAIAPVQTTPPASAPVPVPARPATPPPVPSRAGRPDLAAPAPVASPAPANPAPASDPKVKVLTQRVSALQGLAFPPDLAGKKDEVLNRLAELAAKGDQNAAVYLDGLDLKVAAYQAFRDPAQRKSNCEKMGEEAIALQNLIESRTAGDKKAVQKWGPVTTELQRMLMAPMNIHMEVPKDADADPNQEKKINDAYVKFQALESKKELLARQVKELWIDDKKKQLIGELKGDTDSNSLKMANCLGVEQFLEMAQMAEVMARKSTKGFNPFKPEKGKPGAPTEPMTLAEVAAIYGYSTQDFTTLNGILRGSKTNPAEGAAAPPVMPSPKDLLASGAPSAPAKSPDYRPYIDACVEGLAKLPPFPGTVVRADKQLHSSVMAELIASGLRTEKAFMSAGLKQVPGFGNVISRISGIKTGKEITMFSLHDTEGEVLFPPGSAFRFVSFDPQDGTAVITDYKLLANLTGGQLTKGEYQFTQA